MATIVTRSGKGSALTNTEMDANLNNLNTDKAELDVATTSANGLMSSTDKTKLDTVADNANNFSHLTTDGNRHPPTGGSNGNVLSTDGSGNYSWVVGGGASSFEDLNDTTTSATDPTISINPTATGHIWINKTSGEAYVCTNKATGANVWTNIGGGSGNITPNDPPVITGLTVGGTALASYTWVNINTGSTNTYTIAGATDPDGTDSAIVYSIVNISNANLTTSGGVAGTDNVTLTVATIGSDISGVTFNIRATDEDGGTTDSAQQSIDLISYVYTSATSSVTPTTVGDYKVHTFLATSLVSNGDGFRVTTAGTDGVDYLVVAGGGGGGGDNGGGGGAGGFRTTTGLAVTATNYDVNIGAGGTGGNDQTAGSSSGYDSIFSTITSNGGGVGAGGNVVDPATGGSGGGASPWRTTGGSGNEGGFTPVEGYAGGDGQFATGNYKAGGGGGASEVGANGSTSGSYSGGGGDGIINTYRDGTNIYYAGGGGGGGYLGTAGTGGQGGGGDGTNVTYGAGAAGDTNKGGGGGGGGNAGDGGNGGSGVVIIRYKFQN